uniref:Uncharacterized protein n=1 Tax=Anopheles arabiensis TaxID=7173 RepID=A0A182HGK4_ANOAR
MATETKKPQATIVTLRSRAQMRATEEFINGFNEEKANQLAERLSNLEAVWKAYEAAQLKLYEDYEDESYEEDDKQLNELFDARNAFYDSFALVKRITMSMEDIRSKSYYTNIRRYEH